MFLVKVQEIETKIQELKTWVEGLTLKEATLFDHVEDNPILVPTESAESAIPADAAPRKTRTRTMDGSLTASQIKHRLDKEFGRNISRESIIKLARQIDAKPIYCERQHISRYPAGAAKKIMDLYRTFNQL